MRFAITAPNGAARGLPCASPRGGLLLVGHAHPGRGHADGGSPMSSEPDTVADDTADDTDDLEAGVHASHAVPAPAIQVWQHLISPAGTEALLGEGARIGNKGEPWRAGDGSYGVVRSIHPVEQLRVSWH